jgi:glycosyltransferase involved in cell wall biosynthesis
MILRNAVAPSFLNLFHDPEDIVQHKKEPILAYTSVPFRGLELLLTIFPLIKARVPKAKLKIYSSMAVYQMEKIKEKQDFGEMYQKFEAMEGVEYMGSLPQKDLATAMKKVAILAYPNTFAETACTSAMEAMAAGAHVITSRCLQTQRKSRLS